MAQHAELQLGGFFQGALSQYARTTNLRADQQRDGVERRVACYRNRGFLFVKPAPCAFGGIGGNLHRVILDVGDVRLLRRRAACAHFLHRHHHLNHVHMRNHFNNFRRGHGGGQRNDFAALDVRIAEHVSQLDRIHRHHFFGAVQVDAVAGDKVVDQVEFANRFSVQLGHRAVNDFNRRFWIVRAFHRDKAFFDPLLNEAVLIHRAFRQCFKSFRSHESASWVSDVGRAIVFRFRTEGRKDGFADFAGGGHRLTDRAGVAGNHQNGFVTKAGAVRRRAVRHDFNVG
ncbi:Uncharacterised protein [Salmonella enterica subsp. enterica serovar Typhi]|nr:Uncharacterised protein [Salmonella enterica subsp. enterica serovar Typhi]